MSRQLRGRRRHFTNFGDNIWITSDAPLGACNPTHVLELDGTAFPTWRGSIKAVDVLQNGAIGWEAQRQPHVHGSGATERRICGNVAALTVSARAVLGAIVGE